MRRVVSPVLAPTPARGGRASQDQQRGTPVSSLWTDIPPISHKAAERQGYSTQKPEALLERIITASSNRGDLVLDPFCGCGTTVAVANRLRRRWIGIDISLTAVEVIQRRMERRGTEPHPPGCRG